MPIETAKEVGKVVVETTGTFSSLWQWIVTAIGGGLMGLWGHITGRVKELEKHQVTESMLRDHIDDESQKFDAIFTKTDHMNEKLHSIGESVARIEGALAHGAGMKK